MENIATKPAPEFIQVKACSDSNTQSSSQSKDFTDSDFSISKEEMQKYYNIGDYGLYSNKLTNIIKTKTMTDKYENKLTNIIKTETIINKYGDTITIPITKNTTKKTPRTPKSSLPSPAQKNAQLNNQTENLNDTINAVGEVLTQQHVNGASF